MVSKQVVSSVQVLPDISLVPPVSKTSRASRFIRSAVAATAPEKIALLVCCCIAILLVAALIWLQLPWIALRADLLMWEETDFVGNIIKLNIGSPIYTLPSDGNSMIYNPLAFLFTYAIAWPLGVTRSVPALRWIQVGYVIAAAAVATSCARRLHQIAFGGDRSGFGRMWTMLTFLAMFLAASAPEVNKFVFALHVDSLSLLVSMLCFRSLLRYEDSTAYKHLILMSTLPAVGFLTKQFLVSWIAVIAIYLFFKHFGKFGRLALFIGLSILFIAISYYACYLIWGENYIFWAYGIMGERKGIAFSANTFGFSISRGLDHLIRAWPAVFIGVIGGWLLMRSKYPKRTGPIVLAWVALLASETLSSSAGWGVLYHFGPAVVIGGIFIFASLRHSWDERPESQPHYMRWVNAAVMTGSVVAIFAAWQVIPTNDKYSARFVGANRGLQDVEEYVSAIETEFESIDPATVLIGVGSWVYLQNNILQKDRAISLADQPPAGIYKNIDATVDRIRQKKYSKLLLQDFHSEFFLFDWTGWPRSSGFRDAVLANYSEVRVIPSPEGIQGMRSQILMAGPVSVFEVVH